MEYLTTTEVTCYLGLTYEEIFDLPIKDPNKLKAMFDLSEVVHRLINSSESHTSILYYCSIMDNKNI
jgi:hypothetical protein